MKSVLVCPSDRPQVGHLAVRAPLVLAPLLGHSVLEFWIEALVARGVQTVRILAADRPNRIREHVGDGRRWGVQIDVVPTSHELSADEARARLRREDPAGGTPADDVVVIDHLPGQPELPLFESYAAWFAAQRTWMPQAVTAGRIGVRQIRPGVWAGLRAEIAPGARLTAPCWIGDYARVADGATLGPGAIVDDRAVIDEGARIIESTVGPDTYVGKFVSVAQSLANGQMLVNWETNSSVQVPDALLLADLAARPRPAQRTSWAGRFAAALAMTLTAPFAIGFIALSLLRGDSPWQLQLGLRCQGGTRRLDQNTFAYYELGGAQNWLRRWPQFWSVLRGDMAWTGNRPLRPTQALLLTNDFERLWLAAPVGLISLADAHGCPEGISDEATAHASYYAVHANRALDWFILSRAALRAAMVWPIRGHRRKDAAVPFRNLVPKQEL